jgi:uncharacterized protein (TIGR02271 family)
MKNGENKFKKSTSDSHKDIKAEKQKISVLEEKVEVGKRVIEKAKIRVTKTVDERVESYDIPLFSEEIVVKRVPKNELVETMPEGIRYEGDIMIIPVLKEVAVIEKRIMLVEEIHVSKYKYDKTETRQVVVRKEKVSVERTEILPPKNDL